MERGYVRHRVFVEVLGEELWVAEDAEGELYFPVRPTCKAMDLQSTAVLENIKADSRLNVGLVKVRLPTDGRGDQEQQCLRSTEYSWWLALIDPRRFAEERRAELLKRQRVLMNLARDIMLRRQELRTLPSAPSRRALTPQAAEVTQSGGLEGQFKCVRCGAPYHLLIDGTGWHLHAGVEIKE